MKLIHTTKIKRLKSIKENGMVFGKKKSNLLNELIAFSLNEYKPRHLPDFIDFNKCNFFYPEEGAFMLQQLERFGKVEGGKLIYVEVLSEEIGEENIYVGDVFKNDNIAKFNIEFLLDKGISNSMFLKYKWKELKKIIESSEYIEVVKENKDIIKDYWNSVISFKEYQKERNKFNYASKFIFPNCSQYEIMCFNEIPPDKIKIKKYLDIKEIINVQ